MSLAVEATSIHSASATETSESSVEELVTAESSAEEPATAAAAAVEPVAVTTVWQVALPVTAAVVGLTPSAVGSIATTGAHGRSRSHQGEQEDHQLQTERYSNVTLFMAGLASGLNHLD